MSDRSKNKNNDFSVDNNNNTKNYKIDKRSNKEMSQKSSSSFALSDFKLTILTNTILICVIGYLANRTALIKEDVYSDCSDLFRRGVRKDGIYEIDPLGDKNNRMSVYCNMTAGGWTVILKKHVNSPTNFQLLMESYKYGFGDLNNDHFLGLDNINVLTTVKNRELMAIFNDTQYRYRRFQVLNEYHHYKLIIDDEIDKLPDGSSLLRLNNSYFSTFDVDYDLAANSNCSNGWKAGWWFTDCFDRTACVTCSYLHTNTGLHPLRYAALLIK